MTRARALALTIAVLVWGLLSGSPVAAETFESDAYDYSVEIPDGWQRSESEDIPSYVDEIRGEMESNLAEDSSSGSFGEVMVELFLRPASSDGSDDGPFIVLLAVDSPSVENVSQARQGMLEGFRSEMKSADDADEVDVERLQLDGNYDEVDPGEILVDKTRVELVSSRRRPSNRRILSWVRMGRNTMLFAYFVGDAGRWSDWAEARHEMLDSFEFDEGARLDDDRAQQIGRIIGRFCGIGCCALSPLVLLVVVILVIRQMGSDRSRA